MYKAMEEKDALNEIERLRAERDAWREVADRTLALHAERTAERDALRAAGDRLAEESFSPLEALAAWREVRGEQ